MSGLLRDRSEEALGGTHAALMVMQEQQHRQQRTRGWGSEQMHCGTPLWESGSHVTALQHIATALLDLHASFQHSAAAGGGVAGNQHKYVPPQ